MSEADAPLTGLRLGYVELYVTDLDATVQQLTDRYRFTVTATATDAARRSVRLRQGDAIVIVTQGLADDHRASVYVLEHGDGVADIAFHTDDVVAVHEHATAGGAVSVAAPTRRADGATTAVLAGFGDVVHTLVDTDGPGAHFKPVPAAAPTDNDVDLRTVDHFAVCVPAGQLDRIIRLYTAAFGFDAVFEEHIEVGRQAMNSKVVQNRDGSITFTVIEPDTTADPGQIDDFLKNHQGAGVQHIAFTVADAVRSVTALNSRGVEFLTTPGRYYDLLGDRLTPTGHTLDELRDTNILVDEDHDGQLYQIFTRSVHPRQTLFYEIIERMGAKTFGSANIKALYEAVELDQSRPGPR